MDDSPIDIYLVQLALDTLGFPVHLEVIFESQEALKRLQSAPAPDVLLMDMYMPGLNGLEVLQALKGTLGGARVVLWSAGVRPEEVAVVQAAGAEAYLEKPLDNAALLSTLQTLLGQVDRRAS
ncbi:response regulator [Deinococcus hopiensis]|uniref:response regulator n=1 Tax=Deinococcus hopiensis TaxID=309885 RepID=UPI0014831D6D|nr:response regulator [Deinococcus hopiensis]